MARSFNVTESAARILAFIDDVTTAVNRDRSRVVSYREPLPVQVCPNQQPDFTADALAADYQTMTTANSGLVKEAFLVSGGRSRVYKIWGRNAGAVDLYLQFYNNNAIPADGAVTHKISPMIVPASSYFELDFPVPMYNTANLVVVSSSTELVKTNAAVVAAFLFNCQFNMVL